VTSENGQLSLAACGTAGGSHGTTPPLFRVTAISFDVREQVEAVTALVGGPCLSFIRAEAPGVQVPDGPAVLVTLPVADVMRVRDAVGRGALLDSRRVGSFPVWSSLSWVYYCLLAEDLRAERRGAASHGPAQVLNTSASLPVTTPPEGRQAR
jgi:hypothetical protein